MTRQQTPDMPGGESIDLAHLRNWVGREQTLADIIAPSQVSRLAATLDLETEAAEDGAPLPPAWHWLFFHEVRRMSELGRDGHPALGGFLPPVALPRRMWAGGRLEIDTPLRIGEQVERISRVRSVDAKLGRSGALVFITVEHHYAGADGGAMREEHDIVYRDRPRPGEPAAQPPAPAETAQFQREISAGPVLLFRYSALTFNGHRIHYDLDFCRQQEGYPGLVVHGPLIATFLLESPRLNYPGERVRRFSFRAVSPVFHMQPFQVCGRRDGDLVKLWALNGAGGLAMTAEAALVAL